MRTDGGMVESWNGGMGVAPPRPRSPPQVPGTRRRAPGALRTCFCARYLSRLESLHQRGEPRLEGSAAALADPTAWEALLRRLREAKQTAAQCASIRPSRANTTERAALRACAARPVLPAQYSGGCAPAAFTRPRPTGAGRGGIAVPKFEKTALAKRLGTCRTCLADPARRLSGRGGRPTPAASLAPG